mgnify:CR=1 FL=1
MDAITAIKTRRSIRKFTGEKIGESELRTILETGFLAPSAHNFQPWEYIVVRDEEMLQRIADIHPYGKMLPQAGCGIIVCGNQNKQELMGFLVEDCAASIENMLIAVNSLGLGAVWCGIYPVENLVKSFEKTFDIPKHIIPIGIIALGHPAEEKEAADRYDEEKIHYDKW